MAILLYINGLIDVMTRDECVFDKNTITNLFPSIPNVKFKSMRSDVLKNTWYLWQDYIGPEIQRNYIGSEILKEPIYSLVLIIHDTELDESLEIEQESLFLSYDQFTEDSFTYLKTIKNKLSTDEDQIDSNIVLTNIGYDKDKIFKFLFEINEQTSSLYDNKDEIEGFFEDCVNYLETSDITNIINIIDIFRDNNYCVCIHKEELIEFLDMILQYYIKKEDYEYCKEINLLKEKYENILTNIIKNN